MGQMEQAFSVKKYKALWSTLCFIDVDWLQSAPLRTAKSGIQLCDCVAELMHWHLVLDGYIAPT
jgi:hypothetical protein